VEVIYSGFMVGLFEGVEKGGIHNSMDLERVWKGGHCQEIMASTRARTICE